jgi:hypothetical protein
MNNKISVIKKQINKRCGCTHRLPNKKVIANTNCKSCNGAGELEDSIYYFIDEKNKIAIDSDNLA